MKVIYTDGSCLSNPNGKGGWAAVIIDEEKLEGLISGCNKSTTNNRMELQAVIEALGFLDDNDECLIYSDSQLVINCAVGKWKRNANKDLWEIYDKNIKNKKVKYEWIKGHNGNEYNELVDKVAKDEARLCI